MYLCLMYLCMSSFLLCSNSNNKIAVSNRAIDITKGKKRN